MEITLEPWKSLYRPKTDAELIAKAESCGWKFLRGERFASFENSWGWQEGNCLHGHKQGAGQADYLRALQRESPWEKGTIYVDLKFEHDLDCSFCNRPICFNGQYCKDDMLKHQQCDSCCIRHRTLKEPGIWVCETGDGQLRVYDVPHDYRSRGKFLGFGGAEWSMMGMDGKVISGNNLWHRGDLHPIYVPLVKRMGILTFCLPEKLPYTQIKAFSSEWYVLADWLEESGRPNTAKFVRISATK